ncbi:MAG: FecR domain-containing protein [Alphaproteobacteria bacterium]|nr:FecR domain-containing protein [Alphaproteobacteria bacterium]
MTTTRPDSFDGSRRAPSRIDATEPWLPAIGRAARSDAQAHGCDSARLGLSRRLFTGGVLGSALLVPAMPAVAQSIPGRGRLDSAATSGSIGTVERVVVWGYGTPPQRRTRDLFVRTAVVEDELIETPRDGAVHLVFADGTSFRLGSQSRAMLDRFVFDPARGRGEMSLDLGVGAFRFISGRMDKRDYSLRTPAATIGLRGTDFIVDVHPDGSTIVTVLSGAVAMGRNTIVNADEQAIARGGAAIVVQRRPRLGRGIGDPGLDDVPGGGPDGGGPAGGAAGGGGGKGRG